MAWLTGDNLIQQVSETVNLFVSDSTADKQAKIDAVPRTGLPGVAVTFQFEDGTHNETGQLLFTGFTYRTNIQGNPADPSGLNASQSVTINSASGDAIVISENPGTVYVDKLKIGVITSAGNNKPINGLNSGAIYARYNFVFGDFAADGSGMLFDLCGSVRAISNYGSNIRRMIRVNTGFVHSNNNDDTGTPPSYGLNSTNGAVISKQGTQPAGSIGNELTANGGVIR